MTLAHLGGSRRYVRQCVPERSMEGPGPECMALAHLGGSRTYVREYVPERSMEGSSLESMALAHVGVSGTGPPSLERRLSGHPVKDFLCGFLGGSSFCICIRPSPFRLESLLAAISPLAFSCFLFLFGLLAWHAQRTRLRPLQRCIPMQFLGVGSPPMLRCSRRLHLGSS